jgi:thiamine pyrophosphokinase
MKRLIIITPYSSKELINKYRDYDIIGVDEGIYLAKEEGIVLTYAISNFKSVDFNQVLTFVSKDKILKYSINESYISCLRKIIDFIFNKGYEKIILLEDISKLIINTIDLLQLLKYSEGKLVIQDDVNYISYYSKGNFVISKQGYNNISIIGFPNATISVDHLNKPIENVKIDISQDRPLLLDLYQRVGLLKVHDGGVLLILSNDD